MHAVYLASSIRSGRKLIVNLVTCAAVIPPPYQCDCWGAVPDGTDTYPLPPETLPIVS